MLLRSSSLKTLTKCTPVWSTSLARSNSTFGKQRKHADAKGFSDTANRYAMEYGSNSGLPDASRPFLVLGIETSCDDTAAAVVTSDGRILSNVVHTQYEMHEKFGGIVPHLAHLTHKSNIDEVVESAVAKAGLSSLADIDAVAFTRGPGLEICLRVGCRKAQAVARQFSKPLVCVHHLEAHCFVTRLAGEEITASSSRQQGSVELGSPRIEFPFLVLVVSGGHTSLQVCHGLGEYTALGGALDDSLGEAFDKAARLVGLPIHRTSGGVAVETAARSGNPLAVPMTVPLRDRKTCDFSFAGVKNNFRVEVLKARERLGLSVAESNAPRSSQAPIDETVTLPAEVASDLCASFQHTVFSHVEDRLRRALDYVDAEGIPVTGLAVVGGVAANLELRRRLLALLATRTSKIDQMTLFKSGSEPSDAPARPSAGLRLVCPPPSLCTDNAVMVAWTGVEMLLRGVSHEVEGQHDRIKPRWPLGTPVEGGQEAFRRLKKV